VKKWKIAGNFCEFCIYLYRVKKIMREILVTLSAAKSLCVNHFAFC